MKCKCCQFFITLSCFLNYILKTSILPIKHWTYKQKTFEHWHNSLALLVSYTQEKIESAKYIMLPSIAEYCINL